MDPNLQPEQAGFSQDTHHEEEGANYLRRLKNQSTDDALRKPDAAATTTYSPVFKERRRSPRFQCSGSAEFLVEGSDVRMWGTLTDISLHGCYIEMNATFPVGTQANLTLEALGIRVRLAATVRISYPFLGMGMCFSEIEPAQQLQLEQLLARLLRPSSPSAHSDAPATHSIRSLADVDSKRMIDELASFFRTNQLLSREDFYQIGKRARAKSHTGE